MPLRWVFPGRPGTSSASRPSHLIPGSCAYSHLPDHRIYLSDYRTCAWKTSLFLCPQFRCQDKVLLHNPRVSFLYPYGSSSPLPTTATKKNKREALSSLCRDPPKAPSPLHIKRTTSIVSLKESAITNQEARRLVKHNKEQLMFSNLRRAEPIPVDMSRRPMPLDTINDFRKHESTRQENEASRRIEKWRQRSRFHPAPLDQGTTTSSRSKAFKSSRLPTNILGQSNPGSQSSTQGSVFRRPNERRNRLSVRGHV